MTSDDLSAMETKILAELSKRPECFITHPSEMKVFRSMLSAEVDEFAHRHGWRVIRKVGGRQLQFYIDTRARLAQSA